MASGNYTAKDITVLEGLDPVRKRPGMYIGGVGMAGLHHLVWEILDNAVDEAMNGYAANIWVTLHADGSSITIEDDGRGIPIDKDSRDRIESCCDADALDTWLDRAVVVAKARDLFA